MRRAIMVRKGHQQKGLEMHTKGTLIVALMALLVCAANAQEDQPHPDTSTQPAGSHAIPKRKQGPPIAYYPARALRLHLEGRVLVEFRIDKAGKAFGAKVLQSDADPTLQSYSLRLLNNTSYDADSVGINPDASYRITMLFCLDNCSKFTEYPESDDLYTIHTDPLPPPR